jgi:hypothetical protein
MAVIGGFAICDPTVDVGFVKLMSDSFWKQGLLDEYSVLLFCHLCCSSCVIFRKISFSMYDDLFCQ